CGTIFKKEEVFFPNAFSPNGDRNNDFFGPSFYNIDLLNVKDYLFMVYDRWGTLVFESNDPAMKWNGAHKNNVKSDMGVFYYYCKFKTPLGVVYDKKGDVTLVR
nr:gliding motility-associated C-terminal domain-containing protein [Chitinophagaceae bacterium]